MIKEEYDLLFSEFELNKKNDLNRNQETIKEILSGEIVSRYSFQEGRIKNSLNFDPDVKKALEILSDPSLYKEILTK